LSRDGRRALPVTQTGSQEFASLDDLAAAFQLTVREEAGAITVSYKGRTIVLTPDQPLASVSGRLVSLPAPPSRAGGRWAVPVEFISRALALIYDTRLDLRRPSRLVVIGDLRVPRVTVRDEPLGNAARLTIDATPRAASTIATENERLTIKFDADAIDATVPVLQPQGLINTIRVVDPVTLVVDLGPRFATFRASTENIDTTSRLVVDVLAAQSETTSQTPPAPPPPPSEPQPLTAPAASVRAVAIDPGHGGADEGAKGPGGTLEKDLTLTLARRLKAAIEGRLGIRGILTREEDRKIPLDERTAIANNNKADLFISLHLNASFRPDSKGASIYVAAFDDPDQARTLAPERVPAFGGGMRDIELIPWNLAQIRYLDQSTAVAHIVEQQFQNRIPLDIRSVDRAPLGVLESANMPAVLVELGYLTNPEQEKQLASPEFQATVVQALFDVIVRCRDVLGGGSSQ
jgi:N-acetylmuramoyl-L-alanine amidase